MDLRKRNFAQFSDYGPTVLIRSLLSCVNSSVALPAFYVVCVFKSRSRRQFGVSVVAASAYAVQSTVWHLGSISQNSVSAENFSG
jgi:hypothetical protein